MPGISDKKESGDIGMTTNTYYSVESYKAKLLFTSIPVPNGNEALILAGGISPDLLVTANVNPAAIRRGNYTKLARIKMDQQTVSGRIACYSKGQIYRFQIYYKAVCHVCDPMVVWSSQCPDPGAIAEEYFCNLFSTEAKKYEMQDLVEFQNNLSTSFQGKVQTESGLQIGPLQSVHVDMDEEYREHLRAIQKDMETVEVEIQRVKNAEQLHQAPITAENAMLRDVLDKKKTLDEVLQESKLRKLEEFGQVKTLLEQLNDLRASGQISEEVYQGIVNKQLQQFALAAHTEQQNNPEQPYAPNQEDM